MNEDFLSLEDMGYPPIQYIHECIGYCIDDAESLDVLILLVLDIESPAPRIAKRYIADECTEHWNKKTDTSLVDWVKEGF